MARVSQKQVQINKANTTMIVVLSVSSFIVVFSLMACRALLNQRAYQSRVIVKKEAAVNQLKKNLEAVGPLQNAYTSFVSTSQNVIGGDPKGSGDKDGDNAKIVLDALPSKYDFPALASSLEKITSDNHINLTSITGSDDEIAQSNQPPKGDPTPVDMPFQINVTGNYASIQKLISVFEHSIRPFNINTLQFSGTDNQLNFSVKAKTYYQPEKTLNYKSEVVK